MKDWGEFLKDNYDGRKPLSEVTRDYYLYMQQEEVPQLPDYGFLLSFYNYVKSGGSLEETTPIQPLEGFLLLETGGMILQENGDKIYL
jgi:hypothetical protein